MRRAQLNPDDRMNPNMPVQLFMDSPPSPKTPPPEWERDREHSVDAEPAPDFEFAFKSRPTPEREHNGDVRRENAKRRRDGRFRRIPEAVVCNRTKRNLASTMCDLITHFLRTAANIVVHRFSNYGRDDPSVFVDKWFQAKVPYKFCTIPEVREYIDNSMYGIRDELRPQKIECVCFAIVNDLEESLLEVSIEIFQTAKFWNHRIKGADPQPIRELRARLCRALHELQRLHFHRVVHRQLLRTPTSLTIRYATPSVEGKEDVSDDNIPDGWDSIFPPQLDWAILHPWVDPIRTEFNQMQFHVMTQK
ncbi:hypothetical protein PRIPAC_85298 [Pristionchus pacificus]|uniref:Uncharacterized protein n=1 Tax=Pristionchus pacificus TaxID=54126 RepID=A0A2A6BUU3_PRIPA|nr:hypothetical protein PRIPAC_85298 [Pristionchus pacificus]|eukprot:PDM69752.1 hypothetical protein PRIPAC_44848 [Pristionchus pacificus]